MWQFLTFTVLGLVTAGTYAISASGLVVTYTTTGVFNFAHGAIGMVAAYAFWALSSGPDRSGLPPLLAAAIVVLVGAPLLGLAVEKVLMRRLHGASVERSLMITLGLMLVLLGAAGGIWGGSYANAPSFFGGVDVHIGPQASGVTVTGQDLLVLGVVVLVGVSLWYFLRRTRTGVAMRAVVDDPELLAMAGAPPVRMMRLGWMLGAVLGALAGVLLAASVSPLDPDTLTLLVITGFAAAVFGRLRNLPTAFVGALVLGLGVNYAVGYLPTSWTWVQSNGPEVLPMVLLFAGLLLLPEDRLRAVGRPVTSAPPPVAGLRLSALGAVGVVALAALAAAVLPITSLATVDKGIVFAVVALSLVLLVGYAGQVSLCQLSFVGVGAFAMSEVSGGRSWWGVLAAVGASAAAGVVVALPTVRLRGLYLALATLAFAQVVYVLLYQEITSHQGFSVSRLNIFGIPLQSDRAQLVLAGFVFALLGFLVLALRRGVFGRRLVALADSPAAAATVGLDVKLTRLAVFGLSAAMAGLAGVLYGSQAGVVGSAQDFQFFTSFVVLLLLTIWGVRTVSGALLAGLSYAYLLSPTGGSWVAQLPLLVAGGLIVVGGRAPNGALGLVFGEQGTDGPLRDLLSRTGARSRAGAGGPPTALTRSADAA